MTRTIVLLPLVLLIAGCATSPHAGATGDRNPGTDSPTTQSAPENDPQQMGILMANQRASRLQQRDPQAWLTLVAGTTFPMVMASQRHRHIQGAFPTEVGQIAPYCFFWPTKGPDTMETLPLVESVDTSPMSSEAWFTAPRGVQARVQLNAPPTFILPSFVESTNQVIFPESPVLERIHEIDLASALPRQLAALDRLTPENLVPLLSHERAEQYDKVEQLVLQKYRRGVRYPEDARLAEFANQMRRALNDGSSQTLQFPDSLEALQWSTALTPINVIAQPADAVPTAGQAGLRVSTVGSDGIYRFELWYSSGLREDFVVEYAEPSVTESQATETPYDTFVVGRSAVFEPFGNWLLVDVAQSRLPE